MEFPIVYPSGAGEAGQGVNVDGMARLRGWTAWDDKPERALSRARADVGLANRPWPSPALPLDPAGQRRIEPKVDTEPGRLDGRQGLSSKCQRAVSNTVTGVGRMQDRGSAKNTRVQLQPPRASATLPRIQSRTMDHFPLCVGSHWK